MTSEQADVYSWVPEGTRTRNSHDITPSTDAAKLFTAFYLTSGIAIVALFLNERLKRHARGVAKRVQQD